MENNILNFLKENKENIYTYKDLSTIFSLSEDNISDILSKLINEGLILKTGHSVCAMPKDFFVGIINSTKKGTKYLELNDNTRIYIKEEDLNGSIDFDKVVVQRKDNEFGIVKYIISRKNSKIVCEVKNIDGVKNLVAFNISKDIKFRISKSDSKKLVEGDRILIDLPKDKDGEYYEAKFIKHLSHKDDPDKDIKTIAAMHDFNLEFSDEYLKELEKLPTEVTEEDLKDRRDLRDEIIFTIDSEHTKDIDDAVSLKILPNGNYLLGVHIAHISHYIKEGSIIYEEAKERATSAYLLDYVIPMFHHQISNGICSLSPNIDRLTRSCMMEIDKDGNVVNYEIFKSVINSKKKMTYTAINQILKENIIPEGYKNYYKIIKDMGNLSDILTKKRNNLGYSEFANDEPKVTIDEKGKAINFGLEIQDVGEKLIENFMVITNETIGSHVYWMNLPFIYRIHDCPNEIIVNNTIDLIANLGYRIKNSGNVCNPKVIQSILKKLSKYEEFPILSNLLLRSMKKAVYSTNNIGHFALASPIYIHYTAPIRRFPDFEDHTLLDTYDKTDFYDNLDSYLKNLESKLTEICKYSSYKERQADLAEEDANKFKMLEYMSQYIGNTFEGFIIMIDRKGVMVRTDNLITGKARFEDIIGDEYIFNGENSRVIGKNTHQQYRIGNKISLTVKEVAFDDKEIYFKINENLSHKPKEKVKSI